MVSVVVFCERIIVTSTVSIVAIPVIWIVIPIIWVIAVPVVRFNVISANIPTVRVVVVITSIRIVFIILVVLIADIRFVSNGRVWVVLIVTSVWVVVSVMTKKINVAICNEG